MSTLLTLKKLKINNTALTIPHKVLNIIFLSQIIITTTHNQTVPETAKSKHILTPTPSTIHGMVETEEEPGA